MNRFHSWREKAGAWLSPIVHLSNNWISLTGVVLVTSSAVFWLFSLPISMRRELDNPYLGILLFLVVPAVFVGGLLIIPLGIYWEFRRERRRGQNPTGLPLNWRNVDLRRLVIFVGATTVVNVLIAGQASYKAVTYMDSVTFCGQACHTVMAPEFTAYQNSPHSRVSCVACHIGPGASWFVRSKLSGVGQVFAVAFNTYSRPIPTPVHNLRPARETCETCHWPQKFGADRLRIVDKFAEDEANSRTKTVLLMRIGGGRKGGPGIHGAHLGEGVVIRYAHADEARQTIPWVEVTRPGAGVRTYLAADAKPEQIKNLPIRTMDCMDCHNRPTHTFELPERAVDHAMAGGDISPSLPFVKRQAVTLLKAAYPSREDAARRIPAALHAFYRENYPAVYQQQRLEIERAARALTAIYLRNVFPEMRVTWGTYPNHIGHTDFPGCFRCHDEAHTSADGKTITQDCNTCHQVLAMDEPAPKILTDLGLVTNGAAK
ncbi:MAG: NapC/NirT family cytochrome c [Bryobacterales bacterium]|nr:NapC/NirT family cytochrome c [Bryobacteraceae bacterium]MDW8354627.1 NapC/NirT family cytochrome c [Bryobacterales bacterium]